MSGGRYMFQYNPENPIAEQANAVNNFLYERNYIRLYEKEFAQLSFSHKHHANWNFKGSLEWANRFALTSRTTQTWFPRDSRTYGDNTPDALELELPLPAREKALVASLQFEIRPWQRYQMRNGRKRPIDNSSPTIGLEYRKGIPDALGSVVDYDLIDLNIRHEFRIGAAGQLDLRMNGGLFVNDEQAGFADFKHFLGNRTNFVTTDPVTTYRLLDYYRYSTKDKYASVFAHYQFRKFLFTRIPEVWLTGIKENVFVNYLATPTATNYVELGYSLDNLFRFFRLELAASFEGGRYRDFGVLIGVASNLGNIISFGN